MAQYSTRRFHIISTHCGPSGTKEGEEGTWRVGGTGVRGKGSGCNRRSGGSIGIGDLGNGTPGDGAERNG